MDTQTIELLEENLRDRRESLYKEVAGEELRQTEISASAESELEERAQATRDARILDRLDDRGKREIQAIDAALARIREGTYGVCADCGGRIADQRLRAVPETKLCVECASDGERYARHAGEDTIPPEARAAGTAPRAADVDRLTDAEAEDLVAERLRNDTRIDTEELRVECRSGKLTLHGTLPSEAERQMALRYVTDVLGFRDTVDRVEVTRIPWERRDRSTGRPGRWPDDVEQRQMGEPVETENVVKSDQEGTGYTPPDKPPREEER